MKPVKFPNGDLEMAGNLYLPEGFDDAETYAGIVVVHPGGGVKEQTAGGYAARLAAEGFVALAFDASHQGESGGEPRHAEDPYARVNDVRAAVDHLTTLGYVDNARIGALGICAGGGYAIHATMTDRRIKAVGGVSSVNIGEMFRQGWTGDSDVAQAIGLLEMGTAQRTAEANGGEAAFIPFSPPSLEGVEDPDMREAYDYYRTQRAQHCNTESKFTVASLPQLVTYDAFHLADQLLTQPLQLVAGREAGSFWYSETIFGKAASSVKDLHVVEGATHMSLYDTPDQMGEAMSKLGPFYKAHLAA
ncbi:alpha/beta hydrolase [Shinella zoogloeoides]|uniref:Alpha/beta fold hydrolase n=1 Tax=Shinella zoogloeoides TaxID=352475 RepID=A0A6N8TEF9_SHIZO|nr:alpha/beta hydrolase [Shinella zoogloeoides]MXO01031.1 alpha/beta fold hydrolase [Shinella zoogloeoides]UEX80555.1 alpha/beta hydrolase [Shinella zoogloeoides]